MDGAANVVLVSTEDPPEALLEELRQKGLTVISVGLADVEDEIAQSAPLLVALYGSKGAVELSTLLEDHDSSTRPPVALIASRRELATLMGLNREIVVALLAVEMTDKVVAARVEALCRQTARRQGVPFRAMSMGPRPSVGAARSQPLIVDSREGAAQKSPEPPRVELGRVELGRVELGRVELGRVEPAAPAASSGLGIPRAPHVPQATSLGMPEAPRRQLDAPAPPPLGSESAREKSAIESLTPSQLMSIPVGAEDELESVVERTAEPAVRAVSTTFDPSDLLSESGVDFNASLAQAKPPRVAPSEPPEEIDEDELLAQSVAPGPPDLGEPELDELGLDEPGLDEPGLDEPGHDEPGHDEPEVDEAGNAVAASDGSDIEEPASQQPLPLVRPASVPSPSPSDAAPDFVIPRHDELPLPSGRQRKSKKGPWVALGALGLLGALGAGAYFDPLNLFEAAPQGESAGAKPAATDPVQKPAGAQSAQDAGAPPAAGSANPALGAGGKGQAGVAGSEAPAGDQEPAEATGGAAVEAPSAAEAAPLPKGLAEIFPEGELLQQPFKIADEKVPSCAEVAPGASATEKDIISEAAGHWSLARAAIVSGKLDEAHQEMCLAVAINPESPAAAGLASVYLMWDAAAKSLEWSERALKANPDDRETKNLRGDAKSRLGDTAGALADWTTSMGISPGETRRMAGLATDYAMEARRHRNRGDLFKAETFFRRAVGLDPKNPTALVGLADVFLEKGHLAQAATVAVLALREVEAIPEGYLVLGTALEKQGKKDRARASYERALKIRPDFWKAKVALDALK